ncbi:tumor protein p53-inducible nuclear protein 1-like [Oppia nitens]|uniref:tumor protein p53-inducible nuclear protein 1-like n=1 Tax=Oppia nitens TaxID=1686743 RepID=UPI0023DAFA5A|nr:tumor protein p53-inducible nuclear protein 1-like [Oppia nitens]
MFRFANYVFRGDVDSNDNGNDENIDLNESPVDDDWILIDVPFNGHEDNFKTANQLQTIAANYETTNTSVPQTVDNNTCNAQTPQLIDSPAPIGSHNMDESWFITPPPCFNSLCNTVIVETTPLENLLIEHPSISVFGPSLPPIDHRSLHSDQTLPHTSSTPSTVMSSNDSNLVTQIQSRRQLRQLRRQQQQHLQSRNTNQNTVNSFLRTGILDELNVLSTMQRQEVTQMRKSLTKANMDRQNKVLSLTNNRPDTKRSKMSVRPNGIYNNRKHC